MRVHLVVLEAVDHRVLAQALEAGEVPVALVLMVTLEIPVLRVPELQPVVPEALVMQVQLVIQVIQVQLELALQ
jgi:hypothetical protein